MIIEKIDGKLLKKALINSAFILRQNKELVDELNVFPVPDGDTGTNMSLTMDQAADEVKNLSSNDLKKIADTAAWGSLMGARGNSGVILSQLFRGFSQKVPSNKDRLNALEFANAFKNGVDAAYHAVMRPVEGTILTVARKTAEKMIRDAKHTKDVKKVLENSLAYGQKVLQKTPDMLPALKEAKVVDAGGQGFIYLMEGFLEVIKNPDFKLEELEKSEKEEVTQDKKPKKSIKDEIRYIYCTELIVEGENINVGKLKTELNDLGDSFIIAGNSTLVKLHIHTNNPGIVMQKALKWGELSQIKVDNMKIQHKEIIGKYEQDKNTKKSSSKDDTYQKENGIGVIAVSQGKGLNDIFKSLGAEVIEGGQSMNPSTENILSAIENQSSDEIVILPNNKNIIMTAKQAKQLSDKKVHVLSTRSIPQGISAMINFDPSAPVKENVSNMNENTKNVITGEVTYAVRDSEINGTNIKEGDALGILNGKLVIVNKVIEEVVLQLIEKMVTDKSSGIITLFYGEDVEKSIVEKLTKDIAKRYDQFDVEYYEGNQSLYHYIVSVE